MGSMQRTGAAGIVCIGSKAAGARLRPLIGPTVSGRSMADEPSKFPATDYRSNQSTPNEGDWRWGLAGIVLSLTPLPLALINGGRWIWEIGIACWPLGLIVGLLGLWERGTGRKLAIVGLLMNVVVPLLSILLWPLFVGFMMSRSTG